MLNEHWIICRIVFSFIALLFSQAIRAIVWSLHIELPKQSIQYNKILRFNRDLMNFNEEGDDVWSMFPVKNLKFVIKLPFATKCACTFDLMKRREKVAQKVHIHTLSHYDDKSSQPYEWKTRLPITKSNAVNYGPRVWSTKQISISENTQNATTIYCGCYTTEFAILTNRRIRL